MSLLTIDVDHEKKKKNLLVIIFDTVDLVVYVDRERDTVQTTVADHAAETTWMVGIAHCLQNL